MHLKDSNMKQEWLIKEGNEWCIVFFNGWGMDNNAVKHLTSSQYDVYICSHYSDVNELEHDFNDYTKVNLIAWSLGVYIANNAMVGKNIAIDKKIAINGTLKPCHDDFGIPETIFKTTLSTWDKKNRDKFMMRMLGGKKAFLDNRHVLSKRTDENQLQSLKDIYESILSQDDIKDINWDTAYCGKRDLIFSVDNQLKFWRERGLALEDVPHYPFFSFSVWDEIITPSHDA